MIYTFHDKYKHLHERILALLQHSSLVNLYSYTVHQKSGTGRSPRQTPAKVHWAVRSLLFNARDGHHRRRRHKKTRCRLTASHSPHTKGFTSQKISYRPNLQRTPRHQTQTHSTTTQKYTRVCHRPHCGTLRAAGRKIIPITMVRLRPF